MVTLCYNLQLNGYFSPKCTQDDPCEHLTDVWCRVSLNSIFFMWPVKLFLNILQKLLFFKLL